MNIDLVGHLYSSEYKKKTLEVDSILSNYVLTWMNQGYQIIVTADHGMSSDCYEISQLSISPTICRILGIAPSKKMIKKKFIGLK